MTTTNAYATLAEFRDYAIANGAPNAADDVVIEKVLNAASRYIEGKTARQFYPRVDTRYYSVISDDKLWLDDDLLEVITLLNGEGTAILAASYNLLPRNAYPKYAVQLKSTSSVYWQTDDDAEGEYVIPLLGYWGYHDQYTYRAWKVITTLGEVGVLNAADLTFTLTSAAGLDATGGQLIKIDNELMLTSSKATNDLTVVARGENGSTAATHAIGSTVYLWKPVADIVEATLEIANTVYKRRTGENEASSSVLTTGGVVITPRDIPDFSRSIISYYTRIVP